MRWCAVLGLVWLATAPLVAVVVGTWFARRRRRDSVAVDEATRVPEEWQRETAPGPDPARTAPSGDPASRRATLGPSEHPPGTENRPLPGSRM